MAIARVFEGHGWTPEQYDALMAKLDVGGKTAPGVLFHWVTKTDDGMRATDVYESRDAADGLVRDRIGPAAAELGLPLPEITEYDVYSFLTP
jgi:hypothetical protein